MFRILLVNLLTVLDYSSRREEQFNKIILQQ